MLYKGLFKITQVIWDFFLLVIKKVIKLYLTNYGLLKTITLLNTTTEPKFIIFRKA
jgi:hypothetical protein